MSKNLCGVYDKLNIRKVSFYSGIVFDGFKDVVNGKNLMIQLAISIRCVCVSWISRKMFQSMYVSVFKYVLYNLFFGDFILEGAWKDVNESGGVFVRCVNYLPIIRVCICINGLEVEV